MKLKDGYQEAHTLLKDKVVISLLCTLKGSPIDHPSKPKTKTVTLCQFSVLLTGCTNTLSENNKNDRQQSSLQPKVEMA